MIWKKYLYKQLERDEGKDEWVDAKDIESEGMVLVI